MQRNIFVAVLLLFIIGCTSQQSDQLTQQHKNQIIREVKTVCDTLWAKWSSLDGEATIQYLWDSPEFVAFSADGSRSEFQAFKKMTLAGASSSASLKLAPSHVDFYVLSKDAVMYAWFGKSEFTLKSGDKIMFDPDALTFVFKKVGGQWKIIYIHESATITTQKAGKK